MSAVFERANAALKLTSMCELRGVVTDVTGLVVEGSGPFVPIGSHVTIHSGLQRIPSQVVGFRKDKVLLMPFLELQGISPGATIIASGSEADVLVSDQLLGRVIDGLGNPIDHKPLLMAGDTVPLYRQPPNPIKRARIEERFDLGVRSMNSLLTVGSGQRIGIMAGSGVGKSTLLGMIARHSSSDVNVIALVGERGREVREFIERDLGEEGLKRSVVVVATGNESSLLRIRAAFLATAIAEHFRDQGKRVVLMVDSVTRLCMAQREIGLAIGEPPSTRGYTPSVFAMLPRLLERAGTSEGQGSITGIYTVLVEGDDMNEPVADATRGILDGHIVLSRRLAGKGHFPAIEVLESVSRVMTDIVPPEVVQMASMARDLVATYREAEDLITIGAYKPGQNPAVDRAVKLIDPLNKFLRQKSSEKVTIEESWQALHDILTSE
ncbi:MAG: FliI/YscN family ATPase [Deltaproteobacteria bacterium]|nr:FliI/YscN family ATPase [Deltaproteobacteria bacterium]